MGSNTAILKIMARKQVKKRRLVINSQEADTIYLLKLVVYIILGSQWLRITSGTNVTPIPIGFGIGLLFTTHDHFQIDRKIEYAILLMAMFFGFWVPMGINIIVR